MFDVGRGLVRFAPGLPRRSAAKTGLVAAPATVRQQSLLTTTPQHTAGQKCPASFSAVSD